MKHKIIKTLTIAGLTLTSSLALSGCGKVTVESFSFVGHDEVYEVNDSFNVIGLKLRLKMSDGLTREITVTDDMVKQLPDMTTAGEKTLIIEYDGKEYSLSFFVVEEGTLPEGPIQEYVEVYSIVGVSGLKTEYMKGETLEVGDSAQLTYITSELETKSVKLTADMISGFNSNTLGNQFLTVTYQNKTFKVSYVVKDAQYDEMKDVLQEFLQNYNAQNKVGSTTAKLEYEGLFKFLKDSAEISDSNTGSIREEDITQNKAVYDFLIKNLVNQTTGKGRVVDSNNLKSKLEISKAIKNINESIKNADYYDVVINDFIFTEHDSYYAAIMRDYLSEFMGVESSKGKDEIYKLTIKLMSNIRNKQEIDVSKFVEDLNVIFQEHTTYVEMKSVMNGLSTLVNTYVEQYGNKHALSYAISQAGELFFFEKLDLNEYVWVTQESELSDKYATLLSELVYEFECLVDSANYEHSAQQINSCLDKLIELKEEIGYVVDEDDYVYENYLCCYDSYIFEQIKSVTSDYRVVQTAAIIDSFKEYGVVKTVVDQMGLNGDAADVLANYIYDVVKQNEVDYEEFIIDFCSALGINPTEYLVEYRTNGNVQFVTAVLNYFYDINQPEDDTEVVSKEEILDLAKYIDSLQTNNFNLDTFIKKINAILTSEYEYLLSEGIDDYELNVLVNLTKHGTDYKSIVNYLAEMVLEYKIPEGATNYTVHSKSMYPILDAGYVVTAMPTDNYTVGSLAVYDFDEEYHNVHRIIGKFEEGGTIYYVLHGDQNPSAVLGAEYTSWEYDAEHIQWLIDTGKTLAEIKELTKCVDIVSQDKMLGEVIGVNDYYEIPEDIVYLVRDFINNKGEISKEQIIETICNQFGFDAEEYLSTYEQNGTSSIFTDLINEIIDVSKIEDEYEKARAQAIVDIVSYADTIFSETFEVEEFISRVNTWIKASIDYNMNVGETPKAQEILLQIATSNTARMVKDIIMSKGENLDVEKLIETVCDDFGFDKDIYLENYREHGTCYILREVFDYYIDINEYEESAGREVFEALREVAIAVDELFANDYDLNNLKQKVNAYTLEIIKLGRDNENVRVMPSVYVTYLATSDTIVMVKDLIVSRGENFDVETFIETVCDEFGFDKDIYLTNYREHGTCYILREVFDAKIDLNAIEDEYEKEMYESLREVAIAVDELFTNNYDFKNLKNKINAYTLAILKLDQAHDENVDLDLNVYLTYFVTTESFSMIKDLIITDGENFDAEAFIETVCDEFGFDKDIYLTNYREHGTCYILREVFDLYVNLDEIEDENLKQYYEELRDIAIYFDEAVVNGFDVNELIAKVNIALKSASELGEDSAVSNLILKPLYYATLMREDWVDVLIQENQSEIKAQLLPILSSVLRIEEGTNAYEELNYILTVHIGKYADNEFELNVLIEDMFNFIDEYCEEDVQTYSKSISVMLGAIFYDEEIDYNELFGFIELPEGIENVDYNKLIEKLVNEDTYKMFTISDINIQHITEGDKIVKEIVSVEFGVDFDMLFLSQIDATATLTLEIEF